jgi:hypothetical protein
MLKTNDPNDKKVRIPMAIIIPNSIGLVTYFASLLILKKIMPNELTWKYDYFKRSNKASKKTDNCAQPVH